MIALKLKNTGVFDENLAITGVTSNFLTHKEIFSLLRMLTPGQSLLVTQKLTSKPDYNLSLHLTLFHTPTVFGGVQPVSGSLEESATFMIWNIVTWLTLL
jgi:hypothetical protein